MARQERVEFWRHEAQGAQATVTVLTRRIKRLEAALRLWLDFWDAVDLDINQAVEAVKATREALE